jgi:hypothetical protein
MAAQASQAAFAGNDPEGRWARGPSMRSAYTVSMMACRRWVMSACAVGSPELVKKGVVAPDREQLCGLGPVPDPAHDQPAR